MKKVLLSSASLLLAAGFIAGNVHAETTQEEMKAEDVSIAHNTHQAVKSIAHNTHQGTKKVLHETHQGIKKGTHAVKDGISKGVASTSHAITGLFEGHKSEEKRAKKEAKVQTDR